MEAANRSEINGNEGETDEENVLAVHYPQEIRRTKIQFRDSPVTVPSSPVYPAEQSERREDYSDEEMAKSQSTESHQENDLDISDGLYRCCVYLCASIICFTIMIGIVAVGFLFHLG